MHMAGIIRGMISEPVFVTWLVILGFPATILGGGFLVSQNPAWSMMLFGAIMAAMIAWSSWATCG